MAETIDVEGYRCMVRPYQLSYFIIDVLLIKNGGFK